MTDVPGPRRLAALLLVPAMVAVAGYWALAWIPSVYFDGIVLPAGHDAVYHARRMLDAVAAPLDVVQFDRRIHAPEGSWVNWPWGYDALMASIAALARAAAGVEPIRTLVWVPPASLALNAALLIAITRALQLPLAAQALVALCFALSPLTQNLHAIGQVDHHFLEYTFTLAALLCGLRWARSPERAGPAAALGAVLGLANAVHNGLFVLQVPVLLAAGAWWLRQLGPLPRPAAAFALALLGTTLAVALPSEAWRLGFVRYDLLSWFHVYAACLTALALLLLARTPPGWRSALGIGALLAVAALPLAREVLAGMDFLTAGMYRDWLMPEMARPYASLRTSIAGYSGLLLLLPISLLAALAVATRSRDPVLLCLCAFALCGGALLMQQYRFHQFGSFALYVLPLTLLCRRFGAGPAQRRALVAAAAVALLAYAPCVERLRELPAPGGNADFAVTAALYPALAEACRARPGIVLADHNDGHYVTFFSDCAVVANNLVLGPESWAKLDEARRLLDATPAALRQAAPWVGYVLVRRDDDVFAGAPPEEVRHRNSTLRRALLLDAPPWPAGFTPLAEVRLDGAAGAPVIARLFEVAAR